MKYLSLFFIAILQAKEPIDFFAEIKPKLSNKEQNELTEIESKFVELEQKNKTLSKLLKEQEVQMNIKRDELNEKLQEKDNQLKAIADKNNASTMEITAKKVYFESESKKLEKENKALKNSPFLPKTAKGWAGLIFISFGTVLILRMYYTLYIS